LSYGSKVESISGRVFEVRGSCSQGRGKVAVQAEGGVACVAEETADLIGLVIVVDVQFAGVGSGTTNGAGSMLSLEDLFVVHVRDPMPHTTVRVHAPGIEMDGVWSWSFEVIGCGAKSIGVIKEAAEATVAGEAE